MPGKKKKPGSRRRPSPALLNVVGGDTAKVANGSAYLKPGEQQYNQFGSTVLGTMQTPWGPKQVPMHLDNAGGFADSEPYRTPKQQKEWENKLETIKQDTEHNEWLAEFEAFKKREDGIKKQEAQFLAWGKEADAAKMSLGRPTMDPVSLGRPIMGAPGPVPVATMPTQEQVINSARNRPSPMAPAVKGEPSDADLLAMIRNAGWPR